MGNPDISGFVLYVKWSALTRMLRPAAPGWTIVKDLFDQVAAYNSTSITKKTVQLVVTPGTNPPTWLLGDVEGDGIAARLLFGHRPEASALTIVNPPPQIVIALVAERLLELKMVISY